MRTTVVALVLVVGAIILLALSDAIDPWGLRSIVIGGPLILLLCIPLSLALFSFLSHRQDEQHQAGKQEEQES